MKTKSLLLLTVFLLSACGGASVPAPEVSRAVVPHPVGMSYEQFKSHGFNAGASSNAVQKRFLLLDRDNNGVLSANEFGGY